MTTRAHTTDVRMAELVTGLSLVVDLGLGQPVEHVLRQTLIALKLGEAVGMLDQERVALYYVALLAWVGCGSDSHELAVWFGDDLAWRRASYEVDPGREDALSYLAERAAAVSPPLSGRGAVDRTKLAGSTISHCVVTSDFANRLDLGPQVANSLVQLFERWDGRGRPHRLCGEEIALPARIVAFADILVPFHRRGGVAGAVAVAHERKGLQVDPGLVDVFCAKATEILAVAEEPDSWDAVLSAEPGLHVFLTETQLDRALEGIADFTDLKSPYTVGHARGTAAIAGDSARILGLPDDDLVLIRRAALVQDAGRMGISNSILDKPAPLTPAEMERVRLHPYYVERMLQRPHTLARIGGLARQHHERLDGSGYPRGLFGAAIPMPARVLAAADVYRALTEPRPHRPALSADDAAVELRTQVKQGRLDGDAVNAVLAVAGHPAARRRVWPRGLTAREVEVLALIARGSTNREVARHLRVAEKTVGNHVEHIYTKIGSSTRAEASLFAMKHGLLDLNAIPER